MIRVFYGIICAWLTVDTALRVSKSRFVLFLSKKP